MCVHGNFKTARACLNQVFALREMVEKAHEQDCKVYSSFMNLDKAYDRVDREALWQLLKMYNVDGKHYADI